MLSFEIGVVGCLTKILNSVNYGDCFKSSIGTKYFDIDVYRCTVLGLEYIYIYIYSQSLATNLVVAKDYNFTQYLFIECEYWQTHHWITFSSYILYTCKSSKRSKINNYVINQLLKLQVFVVLNYASSIFHWMYTILLHQCA